MGTKSEEYRGARPNAPVAHRSNAGFDFRLLAGAGLMGATEQDLIRRRRVVQLTREGRSAQEISEILGVKKRSVTRIRRRAEVHADYVAPYITEEMIEQARQLLLDGASYADVAATVGMSPRRLRARLPGMGWSYQQVGKWSQLQRKTGHRVLGG
jgi:hypothetical protein